MHIDALMKISVEYGGVYVDIWPASKPPEPNVGNKH